MHRCSRAGLLLVGAALLARVPAHAQAPSIQQARLLSNPNQVQIEIQTSARIVPQTHLIANPDRLVVDFVNAVPGPSLRNIKINRADAKSLRVGLFSADPPVTRLVVDLNGPQAYQVFPSGRTVIVKIGGAGAQAAAVPHSPGPMLVNANFAAGSPAPIAMPEPPQPVKPPLQVAFHDGMLSIDAEKANLSEVLFAVHQRTGAEIAIPAGAEQEKVVVNLGPAPAPQVLARLLNGSKFNFLILSSADDPQVLDRVILSSRPEGPMPPPRPQPQVAAQEEEAPPRIEPPPRTAQPNVENANPGDQPPASSPELKPPTNNEVPD